MIRRFNRYELKFIIPVSVRDSLVDDLLPHMSPDEHGDGVYRVTSLYFDSPDLVCFRAKIDGIRYRRKVRLRIYDEADSSAMVEIKQRINRTVQKRRVVLPMDEALGLCHGVDAHEWARPDDALVAGEVAFLSKSLRLQPACVISYIRRAFVGSVYEPGLRITFDELLSCGEPRDNLVPPPTTCFLPPDWVVMEVKANDAVPLWVSRMLSNRSCALRRISKYCAGLARLRDLPVSYELPAGVRNG